MVQMMAMPVVAAKLWSTWAILSAARLSRPVFWVWGKRQKESIYIY